MLKNRDTLHREQTNVPSKGSVAASKLANKRNQKEALKKKKMKRDKGTIKEPFEGKDEISKSS